MTLFILNPLIQSPLYAALLIAAAASLLGVFLFLKKHTLVGEVLSHAAFPGITLGLLVSLWLDYIDCSFLFTTAGALLSSLLSYFAIILMKKSRLATEDSTLSFVLASFFGLGILLLSYLQHIHPPLCKQAGSLFFGQLATLDDSYLPLFVVLVVGVLLVVLLFYKELRLMTFDGCFARTYLGGGIFSSYFFIDLLFYCMVVLVTVFGIRTVGMVLISAMFVGPAVAARQYTNRLWLVLVLSLIFASVASIFGIYLSFAWRMVDLDGKAISLPPGPTIVLVSMMLAFFSLLMAPKRGLLFCYLRHLRFRGNCIIENLLKALWKMHDKGMPVLLTSFSKQLHSSALKVRGLLWILERKKYVRRENGVYHLTPEGIERGKGVVRLHRLWEKYLVDCVGTSPDCVHKSAEEIEHILNAELEAELTGLLDNPTLDPHLQPIPLSERIQEKL